MKAASLNAFRWIGKLDCCHKWYARCLQPALRSSLTTTPVETLGFRPGYRCGDIVAIVRQTLFVAYRWGLPLVLGSADVGTAFDTMEHEHMQDALLGRSLHPQLVQALMREISSLSCRIEITGAGQSDTFSLERGGKQGGVETPDKFNVMMSI